MIVEKTMHESWLSNSWLVADRPGGSAVVVDTGGPMDPIVAKIAGKRIAKRHDPSKPQGVRGRNSDNSRLREVLSWEPEVSLERGLELTYCWIHEQLERQGLLEP